MPATNDERRQQREECRRPRRPVKQQEENSILQKGFCVHTHRSSDEECDTQLRGRWGRNTVCEIDGDDCNIYRTL